MLPRLQQKKVKCTSHLNFFEGLVLKYEGQNVKGQGHMGSSIFQKFSFNRLGGPLKAVLGRVYFVNGT